MRTLIFFTLLLCAFAATESCKTKGCPSGQCCSHWGFCGSSADFCGSGQYQCTCDCAAKGPCVATCQIRYAARSTVIRKSASNTGAAVKTIYMGDSICFTEKLTSGWVKLDTGYFVYAGDLMVSNPLPSITCQIRYATKTTTIRASPSSTGVAVKTINKGGSVCFTEKLTSGWVKLNNALYVYAGDLMVDNPNKPVLDINVSQRLIKNSQGTFTRNPDIIVCHIAEGYYEGTISTFANASNGVSCHFVISRTGEIAQVVPLTKSSWCQGITSAQAKKAPSKIVKERGTNPNGYAISIEHVGFLKECQGCLYDAQKLSAGKLIKYIQNEVKRIYGNTIPLDRDHIIGHHEINPASRPNCPGPKYPWSEVIEIAKKY